MSKLPIQIAASGQKRSFVLPKNPQSAGPRQCQLSVGVAARPPRIGRMSLALDVFLFSCHLSRFTLRLCTVR